MNSSRVKIAFFRSAPFTAGLFILSIVLFAVGAIIDGSLISPFHILYIFGMFVMIGIMNFFRAYIDNSKWAMSKPSVVKNFIFAPIYLGQRSVSKMRTSNCSSVSGIYFSISTRGRS